MRYVMFLYSSTDSALAPLAQPADTAPLIVQERETRVAVLMATYNGARWLPRQIETILNQQHVDVRLVISDDMSDDGTWGNLQRSAEADPRIELLSRGFRHGSGGRNFFRLIADTDITGCEYVAFSDQDDVWNDNKLANAVTALRSGPFVGYSSNTLALFPDGSTELVRNDYPFTTLDYYFQGAGQGCTFVLPADSFRRVQDFVRAHRDEVDRLTFHDWLTYAVLRHRGGQWFIDPAPSMQYRQHASNELGANVGLKAVFRRLRDIRSRWYRDQTRRLATLLAADSTPEPSSSASVLASRLAQPRSISARIALAAQIGLSARRKKSQATGLLALVLLGIF